MLFQETVALGVIPEYFDKYFIEAVNVALFGGELGIFVTPQVTQVLRDVYGWRGALLLIAGVNLHSIVCAAVLRPHQSGNETDKYYSIRNKMVDSTKQESPFYARLYDGAGCLLLFEFSFIAQVLVPGFLEGYVLSEWLIYIASLATSKGATLDEAAIIVICAGVGFILIKIVEPSLHKCLSYKHILYIASCVLSGSIGLITLMDSVPGMAFASVIFGLCTGMIDSELYMAVKEITEDIGWPNHYTNGCALLHMSFGIGIIVSGFTTGRLMSCFKLRNLYTILSIFTQK